MSEQLVQAISDKYGVSHETGQQVVNALVEVEKHRQASTGAGGARAIGQSGQTPDIMSIVGSLLSGGQQQGGQQGNQGGDLMGMVGSLLGGGGQQGGQQGNQGGDLMGMIGSLLGGGQPQGGHNMVSILGDLLGGANHPSQAPDLMSIVGSLLGGQQPQGNVNNVVNNLMGSSAGQPTQPTLNHPTQQQLNQNAQHANPTNLSAGVPKPSFAKDEEDRKRSDFGSGGGQKSGH